MPDSVSNTTFPVCDAGFIGAKLRRIKMVDIIAFLIPATQFLVLKIVGRLFLPDMLLALILPVLLVDYGQRLRARLPMIFISLALLWLFGQVATDIVRGTVFSDYARGWSKIGFTLINFCALYLLLYGNQRRLILYAVGLAAGGLISYSVNPNLYAVDYPWKFGYGAPITWFLILLAAEIIRRRRMDPLLRAVCLSGQPFSTSTWVSGVSVESASSLRVLYSCRLNGRLASVRTRPRQVLLLVCF